MEYFNTLEEMYNSREFAIYQESKLGNDLFINDPERAARIHDAAEYGTDGSTTQETIDDWREFLESYESEAAAELDGATYETDDEKEAEFLHAEKVKELEDTIKAISAEIDKCEMWHQMNGSLEHQGS